MDCQVIEDRLFAFAKALLPEREGGEVETHLLACNDCLLAYFELKKACDFANTYQGAVRPALKNSLRSAYISRHGNLGTSRRRHAEIKGFGTWRLAVFAAATVLALGLSWWLPRSRRDPRQPLGAPKAPHAALLTDSAVTDAQSLNTL